MYIEGRRRYIYIKRYKKVIRGDMRIKRKRRYDMISYK